MTCSDTCDAAMKRARWLAELEQQRAARAAEHAARSEARAGSANSPSLASVHARVATLQRHTEQCHRLAARLHLDYAHRVQRWARHDAPGDRPVFMNAVAATAESRGATLALLGANNTGALVAASDATARQAHDLELTLAEGPAYEATETSEPTVATTTELAARWPRYGPAVHELGIQTVVAVALRAGQRPLGSLTVYDPATPCDTSLQHVTAISHALVHGVLLAPEAITTNDKLSTLLPFDEEDHQPLLHQAAGKIAAASSCSIDSALTVIRAHAFAETRSPTDVAEDALNNQLTLP
jgi:GAF domain-containing protein